MAVSASGLSANTVESFYASQSDRPDRSQSTTGREVASVVRNAVNDERNADSSAGSLAQSSSQVRISNSAQAQSAVDNVQGAARSLQSVRLESAVAEVRQQAENFVETYNNERVALTRVAEETAGLDAAESDASTALTQIQGALQNSTASLRDAGIQIGQDGSLSLDVKALESAFNTNPSAVAQTFGDVGRAAEAIPVQSTRPQGVVSAADIAIRPDIAASQSGTVLENARSAVSRQPETASQTSEQKSAIESTARRYGFGAVGAGAYLGIFGL